MACDFPWRCGNFDYELLYPVYFYFTFTYQVWPHLIPDQQNRWGLYGLADHWSMKKPIDADLNLSSPDLNSLRDVESMMCWGRQFCRSMTRSEKKWHLASRQHLFLLILTVCPLVILTLLSVNVLLKLILDHPLYILKTLTFQQIATISCLFQSPQATSCMEFLAIRHLCCSLLCYVQETTQNALFDVAFSIS